MKRSRFGGMWGVRWLLCGLGLLAAGAGGAGCISNVREAPRKPDSATAGDADAAEASTVDGSAADSEIAFQDSFTTSDDSVEVATDTDLDTNMEIDTQPDTEVDVDTDTEVSPACSGNADCKTRFGPPADCNTWVCTGNGCEQLPVDNETPCSDAQDCKMAGVCRDGLCEAEFAPTGTACGDGTCTQGFALARGACNDDHICRTVSGPLATATAAGNWFVIMEDAGRLVNIADAGAATRRGQLTFDDGTASLSNFGSSSATDTFPNWSAAGVPYCQTWDGRLTIGTAATVELNAAVGRDGAVLVGSESRTQTSLIGVRMWPTVGTPQVGGTYAVTELAPDTGGHLTLVFGEINFDDNEVTSALIYDVATATTLSLAEGGPRPSLNCTQGGMCTLNFDASSPNGAKRAFRWVGVLGMDNVIALFARVRVDATRPATDVDSLAPGHALLVAVPDPDQRPPIDGPWSGISARPDVAGFDANQFALVAGLMNVTAAGNLYGIARTTGLAPGEFAMTGTYGFDAFDGTRLTPYWDRLSIATQPTTLVARRATLGAGGAFLAGWEISGTVPGTTSQPSGQATMTMVRLSPPESIPGFVTR